MKEIEDLIVEEAYYQFPGTMVTICCLTVENGFKVVGYSICIDKAKFTVIEGKQRAREKAEIKITEYEAYLLTEKLMEEK